MPRVLVVDDEPTLRASLARGLAKVPGLIVDEAGNIESALRAIDEHTPDVIISDIDLPDRSGVELLGELGKRGLSVPIIFVSAYLRAFRAQIPKHGNFEALDKPVSLEQLRNLVKSKIEDSSEDDAPFSVADYLQLSAMGRHSVRIFARDKGGQEGLLIVSAGTPWSARFGNLLGSDAFAAIAFRTDLSIHCSRLFHIDAERNLDGTMDALLMDAARLYDESRRQGDSQQGGPTPVEPQQVDVAPYSEERAPETVVQARRRPERSPEDEAFDERFEAAIEALLARDFATALEAFQSAAELRPDDQKVIANIIRLKEMGVAARLGGERQ